MLHDLLSQPDLMTPGEIALATIHLQEVEQRLMLDAETERLRAENTRAASTEEAAVDTAAMARRMADLEAENRRLRQSLTDAESKLDALSAIERSLREQSSDGEPP
jgi:predicted  nucleic acid-binding Zn-ribbon protein